MTAANFRPVALTLNENNKARLKREAFRQDTLKAWQEYCATGLHVTAEAADQWLAQLAQGIDAEPPKLQ